jgi:hypothetical protein
MNMNSQLVGDLLMARPSRAEMARNQRLQLPTAATAYGRALRHKMVADWGVVRGMLTGDKPRRDAQGRDVFQVWADLVLANPAEEFARVARDILPPAEPDTNAANTNIMNIGALYLQAVQAANRSLEAKIVDAKASPGSPGPASDW